MRNWEKVDSIFFSQHGHSLFHSPKLVYIIPVSLVFPMKPLFLSFFIESSFHSPKCVYIIPVSFCFIFSMKSIFLSFFLFRALSDLQYLFILYRLVLVLFFPWNHFFFIIESPFQSPVLVYIIPVSFSLFFSTQSIFLSFFLYWDILSSPRIHLHKSIKELKLDLYRRNMLA